MSREDTVSNDEYIDGTLMVGHDEGIYFIPDDALASFRVSDEDAERARAVLAQVSPEGDEVEGFGFGYSSAPTTFSMAGYGGGRVGQLGMFAHGSFGVRSGRGTVGQDMPEEEDAPFSIGIRTW
jgi:hypothetical protein